MSDGINFFGIEEVPPTGRRRVEPRAGWTRTGHEQTQRAGRWLKSSEYHRLLERERREPWAALLGALTVIAAAGLVYLLRG